MQLIASFHFLIYTMVDDMRDDKIIYYFDFFMG